MTLSYEGGKLQAKMVTAYLGLGSNLGNRPDNLNQAVSFLSQRLQVEKVSSVYETEPVGNVNQPLFLNMVCQVYTGLEPSALLALVKGIEAKLGRGPGSSNASRPIDIDILFYGDRVVQSPGLIIPHPRLTERAFVLMPLAEIAPDLVHPGNGKTIRQLLQSIDTRGVIRWKG